MSRSTLLALGGLGLVGAGIFAVWYYQQKKAATAPVLATATPPAAPATQRVYTVQPAMAYAVTTVAK